MSGLSRLSAFVITLAWALAAWAGTALEEGIAAYQRGDGRAALARLHPLAARGEAEAQYYLGRLYYYDNTGVTQSYRTAARWFARAARQGHAAAQYKIGGMYFAGRGVAQDDRRAAHWWRRAAEQNHGDSQNNLGALLANGRGVPRDPVLAYALQTLALEHGAEDAAANLRTKEAAMTPADLAAARALADDLRQPGRLAAILAQRLDTAARRPAPATGA